MTTRESYSLLFRCFKYLLYHKGKHFQLGYIIYPKDIFFVMVLSLQPIKVDKGGPP